MTSLADGSFDGFPLPPGPRRTANPYCLADERTMPKGFPNFRTQSRRAIQGDGRAVDTAWTRTRVLNTGGRSLREGGPSTETTSRPA